MKHTLGRRNLLYPTLTVLVGAMVHGRPNFITIAHVGILTPQTISIGVNKSHYTNDGIKETGTFSINIPSVELAVKTDYCGIVSGRRVDKSEVFEVFYGELGNAPMIKECAVNMECQLVTVIDMLSHDIFVGKPVQTYVDEAVLSDGYLDLAKLNPLLFDMTSRYYWTIGEKHAPCWKIGNQLSKPGQP
ncbi:MAG: flavin reductase family protein [Solirubrobacterales bacterium]